MKLTLEQLQAMVSSIRKNNIKPIEVYIVDVGDKVFMCPVSDYPKEIAPSPCEITLAEFPIEVNHGNLSR